MLKKKHRISIFWAARFVLTLAFLVLIWVQFFARPVEDAAFFLGQPEGTELIAHQGGNLERPDETLAAFAYAVGIGAHVLELDVHLSADDELIVIHDDTVDRTTDGRGRVRDLALDELKALDAAYWWPYHSNADVQKLNVPEDMEFPYRGTGLQILELSEVLLAFPDMRFVIELKVEETYAADLLVRMLERLSMTEQVVIASFYPDVMGHVRNAWPEIATSGTEREIVVFYALHRLGLAFLYSSPVEVFQVPMEFGGLRIMSPRFLRDARSKNIRVQVWTINDVETMDRLIDMGVDGIMTDRPALLRERLDRQAPSSP